MSTLFALIGLGAFFASIVMLIKAFIKKTPKKKALITLAVSFVLMGAVGAMEDDSDSIVEDTAVVQAQEDAEVVEEEKELEEIEEKKPEPVATKSEEEIKGDLTTATFQLFCSVLENPIVMSSSTENFIKSNSNLFPAPNYEAVSSLIDHEIGFRHIAKSPSRYDTTFIQTSGTVISIEEVEFGDDYLSIVHILDSNFDSFYACYIGELPNVFKDDKITIVGIPLGNSGFTNVGGGTTNIVAVAASRIGKN